MAFPILVKMFQNSDQSLKFKTWLMLIYGVSGIFAHKKTIKQFLQPIIRLNRSRGGGGGGERKGVWMCREDVSLFLGEFFRVTIFLCQFF